MNLIESIIDYHRKNHRLPEGADVGVKGIVADSMTTKQESDGSILVRAVANTAAVDLSDEVVIPDGCEVNAQKQPVYLSDAKSIYLSHRYDLLPIGTFRTASLGSMGWLCSFIIHDRTELSRDVQGLLMMGADSPVRGVSIGFQRVDAGKPSPDEIKQYGPHGFTTRVWKWMELSVTPQPCNPEAWITTVQKGIPTLDDATAGIVDNLASKGLIRSATASALGLVKEIPTKRKKLLIIPRVGV